ncbi:MAG: Hydrolase alpha/beta domain [Planctomycetota bacterium]|nr:MAG: Hydrolase alpha/beta domain [Planctomycetota bacterium]
MSNFGGERAERMRDSLALDRLRALAEFYRLVWSDADRRQPGFDELQKELAVKRRIPSVEAMVGTYNIFSAGLSTLPLENVACPVLVAHGTGDGVSPLDRAAETVKRIPRSRLVPVDGAGHVPFLTFPEKCREILRDFWSNPASR